MSASIRIATRNSPLALWQAHYVGNRLSSHFPDLKFELVPMSTSGDRFLQNQNKSASGKGLFVKELEEALLNHHADIAVHSMKDVPATHPDGLGLVAITQRDNPYDALVSSRYHTLEELPHNAVIGTSSLRRQSQLLNLRPDLNMISVRGNIQTRLQKLHSIPCDALILAAAGLIRMNLAEQIQSILPEDLMLPACGQGALGVECRLEDHALQNYLRVLNDPLTALCVHVERQVNARLGGNCHVPIAVFCKPLQAEQLLLQAKVLSFDGKQVISAHSIGLATHTEHLVTECVDSLFAQGANTLLSEYDH